MEYLRLVFKAFSRRFQGVSKAFSRHLLSCVPEFVSPRNRRSRGKKGDGNLTLVGINKNAARNPFKSTCFYFSNGTRLYVRVFFHDFHIVESPNYAIVGQRSCGNSLSGENLRRALSRRAEQRKLKKSSLREFADYLCSRVARMRVIRPCRSN